MFYEMTLFSKAFLNSASRRYDIMTPGTDSLTVEGKLLGHSDIPHKQHAI